MEIDEGLFTNGGSSSDGVFIDDVVDDDEPSPVLNAEQLG
jgi:hypothetical protein